METQTVPQRKGTVEESKPSVKTYQRNNFLNNLFIAIGMYVLGTGYRPWNTGNVEILAAVFVIGSCVWQASKVVYWAREYFMVSEDKVVWE